MFFMPLLCLAKVGFGASMLLMIGNRSAGVAKKQQHDPPASR
jgi:hypothetical protein